MQEHYMLYCIARYKKLAVDLNFYEGINNAQGVAVRKESILCGVFNACKYSQVAMNIANQYKLYKEPLIMNENL
jgi:hypothetical protein